MLITARILKVKAILSNHLLRFEAKPVLLSFSLAPGGRQPELQAADLVFFIYILYERIQIR